MSGVILSEKSEKHLKEFADEITFKLSEYMEYLLNSSEKQHKLAEAMCYSLSAGGKRLRPVLAMEFCSLCGGSAERALSSACALEMVHTFSLIHDDLPCMDDDDVRRGKPSCHIAFGEADALLAGDALLNMAYGTICRDIKLSAETKVELMAELSDAAGVSGMIGGQVVDTIYDGEMTEKILLDMYSMKTGALLRAACKMGCIAAGADRNRIKAAERYAEKLGLAFQIVDDILDVEGDEKLLGKPVGSDSENGKTTYVSLCGPEKAREIAEKLTNEALDSLGAFGEAEFLRELTKYLLKREY